MSGDVAQFIKAGAVIELDLGACTTVPLGPVVLLHDDGSEFLLGEAISYRGYGSERRYVVATETAGTITDWPADRLRRLTSERKD